MNGRQSWNRWNNQKPQPSFRKKATKAKGSKMTSIEKPSVLIAVLCGNSERNDCLPPDQVNFSLQSSRDVRFFRVGIELLADVRPVACARNTAIIHARQKSYDYLLMLDSDAALMGLDLLQVLSTRPPDADICVLAGGIHKPGDPAAAVVCLEPVPNRPQVGNWIESRVAGAHCMLLSKRVWKEKGPWFKSLINETSETGELVKSEDLFFCDLMRQRGLTIWVNTTFTMPHLKTVNLSGLIPRTPATPPPMPAPQAPRIYSGEPALENFQWPRCLPVK